MSRCFLHLARTKPLPPLSLTWYCHLHPVKQTASVGFLPLAQVCVHFPSMCGALCSQLLSLYFHMREAVTCLYISCMSLALLAMSSLELWRGGVLCDDIEFLLMYVSISQAHGENYKRLEQESNVCARSQREQHRHYIFIFSCKSVYPCVLHSHY